MPLPDPRVPGGARNGDNFKHLREPQKLFCGVVRHVILQPQLDAGEVCPQIFMSIPRPAGGDRQGISGDASWRPDKYRKIAPKI